MSDSSSDDASDVEMDEEELEQLIQLEEKLQQHPRSYQDHVQYITLLERSSMNEKLHQARTSMKELFPLPETMWMSWLMDELTAVTQGADIHSVLELSKAAVQDYLSIPLWKLRMEVNKDFNPDVQTGSEEGHVQFRELCEAALEAAGLHFTEGHELWHEFRQWELEQLRGAPGMKAAEERVRALYQRQLKLPMAGLPEVMEEYRAWEAERSVEVPSHASKAFEKAQAAAQLRQMYEKTVAAGVVADSGLLSAYISYIKFEADAGEVARVRCLYERAIRTFPTVPGLWLRYMQYMEQQGAAHAVLCSVAQRAARNCHRNGQVWAHYLTAIELSGATPEAHAEAYELAMSAGIKSDVLEVMLARADFLRRQAGTAGDPQPLRAFFAAAMELLSGTSPASNPAAQLRLASYWAHCEVHVLGSVEPAEQLWEDVLAGPLGRQPDAWRQYISLQRSLRRLPAARALYSRVLQQSKMDPAGLAVLAREWVQFEREEGGAEEQAAARRQAAPHLEAPALQVPGAAGKPEAKAVAAGKKKRAGGKRQDGAKSVQWADQQAQAAEGGGGAGGEAGAKRQRGADYPDENELGLKRPKVLDESNILTASDNVQAHGSLVEPTNDGVMEEAGPSSRKTEGGKGAKAAAAAAAAAAAKIVYTDQQTVFVRNLGTSVTEQDLRQLFKDCGEIREIRIPKDQAGVPKGFAYVELSSDDQVQAAEKLHGEEYHGQRLFVKKSDPPKRPGGFHGRGRGHGPQGAGRGGGAQEGEAGATDARHQSDAGRGHAARGRHRAGGRGYGGRGRGDAGAAEPNTRPFTDRPKAHLELSGPVGFMPRSVQQNKSAGGAQEASKPSTNADFRKMLFGDKDKSKDNGQGKSKDIEMAG